MVKEYWITNSRFKFIAMLLFLMWVGFMVFLYLKAEEISKNPCAICAEKMGEEVSCYTQGLTPLEMVFYPNGSITFDDG